MSTYKKDDTKKHAHIILEEARIKKFERLKKAHNLNSDVDVLRFCIDQMHENLKRENIDLRPILKQQAELLLKNEYLASKYLVLNLNDIINESVHLWLRTKKTEINLHHLPFRQELSEEEQKVALAFAEKQFDHDNGLTRKDLEGYIKEVTPSKIETILRKFKNNRLVTANTLDGDDYYYAPLP